MEKYKVILLDKIGSKGFRVRKYESLIKGMKEIRKDENSKSEVYIYNCLGEEFIGGMTAKKVNKTIKECGRLINEKTWFLVGKDVKLYANTESKVIDPYSEEFRKQFNKLIKDKNMVCSKGDNK